MAKRGGKSQRGKGTRKQCAGGVRARKGVGSAAAAGCADGADPNSGPAGSLKRIGVRCVLAEHADEIRQALSGMLEQVTVASSALVPSGEIDAGGNRARSPDLCFRLQYSNFVHGN